MCVYTASRNVFVAVNSWAELICSLSACTSNIVWRYVMTPTSSSHGFSSLLTTLPCNNSGRCQISSGYEEQTGRSLMSIEQVQFTDAGTYLCSCGTMNQPGYCEMSFNFTGSFQCILLLLSTDLLLGAVRPSVCLYVLL